MGHPYDIDWNDNLNFRTNDIWALVHVTVSLRFRPYISNDILCPFSSSCLVDVAFSIAWLFSRLSKLECSATWIGRFPIFANTIYQFVSASTTGTNIITSGTYQTLEVHVRNWVYGVQLAGLPSSASETCPLSRPPQNSRDSQRLPYPLDNTPPLKGYLPGPGALSPVSGMLSFQSLETLVSASPANAARECCGQAC